MRAKALSSRLVLSHIREFSSSKVNLQCTVTPKNFSDFVLEIISPFMFTTISSSEFIKRWLLSLLALMELSSNLLNNIFEQALSEDITSAMYGALYGVVWRA